MPSVSAYMVVLGFIQLVFAATYFLFPRPANPDFLHVLAAFGAGLLNAFALVILLNCLQKGEVSRVIPVTSSSPIFVALLSMPILGEMLNFWQWLAVFLTVAGAVLVSLQLGSGGQKAKLQKSFLLLFLAALLFASSNICFKYALETFSSWNTFAINGVCVGVVALAFSVRKSTFLELKNLAQRTKKFLMITGVQLIAAAGITLSFVAIASGPVALVSTIMNIRPVFVFIFSLIISRLYPGFINEHLNRSTVIVKLVGIVMITAGVAIISLSS